MTPHAAAPLDDLFAHAWAAGFAAGRDRIVGPPPAGVAGAEEASSAFAFALCLGASDSFDLPALCAQIFGSGLAALSDDAGARWARSFSRGSRLGFERRFADPSERAWALERYEERATRIAQSRPPRGAARYPPLCMALRDGVRPDGSGLDDMLLASFERREIHLELGPAGLGRRAARAL